MAKDVKTIILMPTLNAPADYGTGTKTAQLELTTTNYTGCAASTAHLIYTNPQGNLTFGTDDYLKTVRRNRVSRVTQKVLDAQHAEVFTPENIETIKADVIAHYAAKRRNDSSRRENLAGLGSAVKELMDSGIDASTALRMCNAD